MPWVVDTFPAMGMFWPLEALDLKVCPPSQGVTPKPWALEVATRYIQGPSGRFFSSILGRFGWGIEENIAKGTTDPGVDCFDQLFWFGRPGSVCLVSYV